MFVVLASKGLPNSTSCIQLFSARNEKYEFVAVAAMVSGTSACPEWPLADCGNPATQSNTIVL